MYHVLRNNQTMEISIHLHIIMEFYILINEVA